jgi:hypothetical protein
MLDIVSILCFTPQLSPLVERVITSLNVQDLFRFQVVAGASLPDPDKGQVYSFRLLDSLLLREKQRLGVRYLLGIMDQGNERNCFSHSRWRIGTGFITTFGWEYLSWLPTHAFVAYAIVRNVVTMLGGRRSFHEETLGCLFDYCAHKPDYSFKIRTADICPECLDFLRTKLEPPDLDAIILLLEQIRLTALARGGKIEPIGRSLSEAIDQVYPFPIAYCFRSMQAELSYSRKWLKLLELYEVTINCTFRDFLTIRHERPTLGVKSLAG